MEALSLTPMQHLPTAIMYVMDISGGAGNKCSSIQDQLKLRKEVRLVPGWIFPFLMRFFLHVCPAGMSTLPLLTVD